MHSDTQSEDEQPKTTKFAAESESENDGYISSAGANGGGDAPMIRLRRVQEPSVRPMSMAWNSMLRSIGRFGQRDNKSAPTTYEPPKYARKVFIGGLPQDIDDLQLSRYFCRFGPVIVDWPHKNESEATNPPRGFAFLLFSEEKSVQYLVHTCDEEDGKLYITISSRAVRNRLVQVRPWRLTDADHSVGENITLDFRRTVFIGGVPRPLTAFKLAKIFGRMYGGVCYAGIDTDPDMKYPKGSARISFNNQQSYANALARRFVRIQDGEIDKRIEVKPYLLENQMCERCHGDHSNGMFATIYCSNISCRIYYCEYCWWMWHSTPVTCTHKPLIRNASERIRLGGFRWF